MSHVFSFTETFKTYVDIAAKVEGPLPHLFISLKMKFEQGGRYNEIALRFVTT